MAEKRQFLDVWIVESNTVYREVPFAVVTDWIQQSRLLAEDKLRPAGTAEWFKIGSMPAFTVYLPKPEPFRAEDQAEALEPVQLDLSVGHSHGELDEDVDMIPLIDVSLVLLIFFMMTAAVGGAGGFISTPEVEYKQLSYSPDMLWIGIRKDDTGEFKYYLGKGDNAPETSTSDLTEAQVLHTLDERIKDDWVDVRVMADRNLPYYVVENITRQLEMRSPKGSGTHTAGIRKVFAEVSEKEY